MKSTFAVVTGPKKIEFIEEELPALGPHDLLIKTDAVGLCHTDLPIYEFDKYFGTSRHGYRESQQVPYGCKLGHEPVGTVLEVGSAVTKFAPGDKVSGNYTQAFATYRVVPDDSLLVRLPAMEQDYRYCVVEPMGCVTNILHHVFQDKVETIGLIGCGYMNLMVMAALRNTGVKEIVAFDLDDEKLELAKKFGATQVVNSATEDFVERVYQLTGGQFLDCVVEMCGSLGGLLTACRVIKFSRTNGMLNGSYNGRGRIFITSVYSRQETFPVDLANEIVLRGPILDASHPMTGENMLYNDVEAMQKFVDGTIPLDHMISHTVPFRDLAVGMDWLARPPKGYIKGVVLFD